MSNISYGRFYDDTVKSRNALTMSELTAKQMECRNIFHDMTRALANSHKEVTLVVDGKSYPVLVMDAEMKDQPLGLPEITFGCALNGVPTTDKTKHVEEVRRSVYGSWLKENPYIAKTPTIKQVIFNNPATIIIWSDGVKTVVKARGGDTFDPEKGLAIAIAKRMLGNKHAYYNEFAKWLKKAK